MNKRKQKTNPFIISLLLHLLFMVYFLFFAFKQHRKFILATLTKQQRQRQQQQLARRRRAALFPKRSDEGTQIVFDDAKIIPKPKKEPQETMLAEKEPEAIIKKMIQGREVIPQKAKEKIIKKIVEKVIEEKVIKSKTKFVDPVDFKKLALENLLKEQIASEEEIEEEKKETKKSLLSLTKCFLDHEKGNSSMCRSGEDRKPTFEELKYICYEKQIQDSLVATWRTLYSGVYIATRGETKFTFVINENGQAEQIVLCRSSGNRIFDDMVLESVKQAVFPPIPKHFGVTKYRPQGGVIVLR